MKCCIIASKLEWKNADNAVSTTNETKSKIPMRSDPYHVTTEIDKWEKAGEEEHGNFNVRISISLSV